MRGRIRFENDRAVARLLFGTIASTELPITGDDAADVVVAQFDGDFDCSQKPRQLSGVIGSVEIFTSRETRARWSAPDRRVVVLNVDASPSGALWLFALVAGVLAGAVIWSAYFLRLFFLRRLNG